jgi:flagellar hook-basal body complex protein FliE
LTKKELVSLKTVARYFGKMQQHQPSAAPTTKQIDYLLTLKRRLDPTLKTQHGFDKLTRDAINGMTRKQVSHVIDTMLNAVKSQSPQSVKARNEALKAYHKACKQVVAYSRSVYATPENITLLESRVKDAHARCIELGLGEESGL